jgi:hypothetical protein
LRRGSCSSLSSGYFYIEASGFVFLCYLVGLLLVVCLCASQDLQKAGKGAAGPRPSWTSALPPPKAPSTGLALTLVADEAMASPQVPETEAAKEKGPLASGDADAQKHGGATTQSREKTPSPSRADPKVYRAGPRMLALV